MIRKGSPVYLSRVQWETGGYLLCKAAWRSLRLPRLFPAEQLPLTPSHPHISLQCTQDKIKLCRLMALGMLLLSPPPNLNMKAEYSSKTLVPHLWSRKVKQSHDRPGQALRVQEAEAHRFQDNWHMKVVRLSALCTSRLYRPGNIPGTHFCS